MLYGSGVVASRDEEMREDMTARGESQDYWFHCAGWYRDYILESDDCMTPFMTPFMTELVSLLGCCVVLPFTRFLAVCHTVVKAAKWYYRWNFWGLSLLPRQIKAEIWSIKLDPTHAFLIAVVVLCYSVKFAKTQWEGELLPWISSNSENPISNVLDIVHNKEVNKLTMHPAVY